MSERIFRCSKKFLVCTVGQGKNETIAERLVEPNTAHANIQTKYLQKTSHVTAGLMTVI
jgi:hypothetical protein